MSRQDRKKAKGKKPRAKPGRKPKEPWVNEAKDRKMQVSKEEKQAAGIADMDNLLRGWKPPEMMLVDADAAAHQDDSTYFQTEYERNKEIVTNVGVALQRASRVIVAEDVPATAKVGALGLYGLVMPNYRANVDALKEFKTLAAAEPQPLEGEVVDPHPWWKGPLSDADFQKEVQKSLPAMTSPATRQPPTGPEQQPEKSSHEPKQRSTQAAHSPKRSKPS